MNFDPTTNRIPYALLTPEEQATLKAWPHGVEYYRYVNKAWTDCNPVWDTTLAYRGKPAPKVTSYWFNIYDGNRIGHIWNSQDEAVHATKLALSGNFITMRMQVCNGEVTVTKET